MKVKLYVISLILLLALCFQFPVFSSYFESVFITDPTTGEVATVSNYGTLYTGDFMTEVAKGNIAGHSVINKFGKNPASGDNEDLWAGSSLYSYYPTTAEAITVVSDDGDDTSGDTGARTVVIQGLDANWDEQISDAMVMNGASAVNVTIDGGSASTWIRVFRASVETAGSSKSNEGIITVAGATGTGAIIDEGKGQTQQCIYTIPNGKTGYFIKGYVAVSDDSKDGDVAEFEWQSRSNVTANGAWQVKGDMACNSLGSGTWQYRYGIPVGGIPAKTDIKIYIPNTTAVVGTVGGFDMLLVEDGY